MDLNYDLKKWDFTLRATTLTAVTKNIVEAARLHPTCTISAKTIAKRATKRAGKLDLLPGMITEIKIMIRPIMKGILGWYELYGFGICPSLTPVGTVDVEKSAKALVECTDQPINILFNVACDHCLEEEIFRFGSQLSRKHKADYNIRKKRLRSHEDVTSILQLFWLGQMYGKNFIQIKRKITLDSLSEQKCIEGMNSAMLLKNWLAVEYFWKRASRCADFNIKDYTKYIQKDVTWIPPALLVKLLQFEETNYLMGIYPNLILRALLQWPYQHLFLKAAERLLPRFKLWEYFDVLKAIINIIQRDYGDYNYKRIFIGFWRMSKDHQIKLNIVQKALYFLLTKAFLINDRNIAFTVFDVMLESNREGYFLHFFKNDFEHFIFSGKYEELLLILHVCKVRDQRLYLKCKSFVRLIHIHRSNSVYPMGSVYQYNHRALVKTVNLQEFVELMTEWEKSGCPNGQSTVR